MIVKHVFGVLLVRLCLTKWARDVPVNHLHAETYTTVLPRHGYKYTSPRHLLHIYLYILRTGRQL